MLGHGQCAVPVTHDNPVRARERDSFFADRHANPGALRVCRGLSCELAGAAALEAEVARASAHRRIYCAGYCDRSPALLRPDGVVLGRGLAPLESLPAVHVRSRTAVVAERLRHGECRSLSQARAAATWSGLERALRGTPDELLRVLERSGERGRGGSGFPTGAKWRAAAGAPGADKYVIANGDEGDPGSFVDRALLEADPHAVLEGLALCGYAIGARHGIVYVRSEYPRAAGSVAAAADAARGAGLLGRAILGSDFHFDVRIAHGEGSYVCGEETALIASLEGKRGEVEPRPPYPTRQGLFGRPTVVNNVETLVNAAWIARRGPDAYRALGTAQSPGTKALSLNHGFARPGIHELEFGASLAELVEREAEGMPRVAAIALGGPMGSVLTREEWDMPLSFEALEARGVELGHGGIVALPEGTDFGTLAIVWLEFMADESCGKCVPCRVGSRRALELAKRGGGEQLRSLLDLIASTSLCGFGRGIPAPVRKLLELARRH